jgi:hypothetical protein
MDIGRIIFELRQQQHHIDEAIATLERLAFCAGSKETGSDELSSSTAIIITKKRRFSPEARKRMADAQHRRWAAVRSQRNPEVKSLSFGESSTSLSVASR